MLNMSYSELEKEVYRCFEIFIPSKKLFYGVRTFPVNPANLKTSLCRSKLQPALNKGMPVSLRKNQYKFKPPRDDKPLGHAVLHKDLLLKIAARHET